MTKNNLRKKGLILLILVYYSLISQSGKERKLKQGQNLKSEADAEAVEERCLLPVPIASSGYILTVP